MRASSLLWNAGRCSRLQQAVLATQNPEQSWRRNILNGLSELSETRLPMPSDLCIQTTRNASLSPNPRRASLPGVAADPGMFARRFVLGAARMMSATDSFSSAHGTRGSLLLQVFALENTKTRTGRAVGLRTACLAAQRPIADEVGNGLEEDGSLRLGREIAKALQGKGTRLILHLDLNKTLIMVDPAGRKTQSQVWFELQNGGVLCWPWLWFTTCLYCSAKSANTVGTAVSTSL